MSLKNINSRVSSACLLAVLLAAGPVRGFELQPFIDDAVPNLVRYINVGDQSSG